MTDKIFDSFIKQKLENFESKVPEGLWEKIMPEEKEKPKGFWWFNKTAMLIAIALLIGGASTTYIVTKNESLTNINSGKTSSQNLGQQSNFDIKQNNDIAVQNNLESKNSQVSTKHNANKAISNEKLIVQQPEALTKKINTEEQITFSKPEDQEINKGFTKQNNPSLYKKNGLQNSTKPLRTNQKSSSFNNDLTETNSFRKNNQNLSFFKPAIFQNSNLAINNTSNKIENTCNKNIDFKIGNLFGKTEDCPTAKGSSRNDFYLEAYASPDYTFKKVISTANGLDQYLTKKDSVEVLRGGFTIGARISKSITENLLLKAGIQYSQINEEFRLKTENERRQTIVINTHTITRPGNSDTTISDTSYYVQVGYRLQTNMNYYKNVEIPILLSYEFGESNSKWKYAINTGAIVNITSWYEGRTLDTNYKMVSISNKSANSFYKQNIGLSLYGGFSILRKVSDNVDVFAEPYFRLSLNKIESSSGFNQKFNAVGLQVGARIKLSKDKHL